mmetsp:Transcript_8410/g.23299  ORF Transcript_8410/g.23299 Transcript_8410/m.23299 type:complete len:323 (-) Transcript_8410:1061-2029(-)
MSRNPSKFAQQSSALRMFRFHQPRTKLAPQTRLVAQTFRHQNQGRLGQRFHHGLVHHIQGWLVDQTNVDPFLGAQSFDRIQRSVQGIAKRHHVSGGSGANHFVLSRNEFVSFAIDGRNSIFLEQNGCLGSRRKDKTQPFVGESLAHQGKGPFRDLCGLQGIGGKVQSSFVSIVQSIVGKKMVQAKMTRIVTHIIDTGVTKVGKDIGTIQPCHGNFAAQHFQKGGKGGKDPLTLGMHAKARRGGKIPTLHDPGMAINFGTRRFDTGKVGRTSQIAIHHQGGRPALVRIHGLQNLDHGGSHHFAHGIEFGTPLVMGNGIFGFGG